MRTTGITGSLRATMRRRLVQVVAALAIVTGLSVATAGTAVAANVGEWACDYDDHHNACLYITNLGDNMYLVHVGVDIYMTQQDAQNIINSGFLPTATLYGDDGSSLSFVTTVPLAGSPTAWSGGYSAEFDTVVSGSQLDEDDGVDEIVAKVRQWIPASQRTLVYKTGRVTSAF
jgi:hypothetical protein